VVIILVCWPLWSLISFLFFGAKNLLPSDSMSQNDLWTNTTKFHVHFSKIRVSRCSTWVCMHNCVLGFHSSKLPSVAHQYSSKFPARGLRQGILSLLMFWKKRVFRCWASPSFSRYFFFPKHPPRRFLYTTTMNTIVIIWHIHELLKIYKTFKCWHKKIFVGFSLCWSKQE